MASIDGLHHVAVLTTDLDRKRAFYRTVFDVEMTDIGVVPAAPHLRSGLLPLGVGCALHVVEDAGSADLFPGHIGRRGPVDHLGFRVATRPALGEVVDRLVAAGASDGEITDYGDSLSVFFRDCDGMECEVCWIKTDAV